MTVFDLWLGHPAPQPETPPAPVPPPPILPKKIWKPKEKPKVTIKDLPTETLVKIFKYLNPADINAMSLTCKRMLDVSKYNEFLERKVLNLHKVDFHEDQLPISMFKHSFRYFTTVSLYLVRFMDNNSFWRIFGLYIKEIQFRMCVVKKEKFLSIVKCCPNLESLTIYNFDELLSTWDLDDAGEIQFIFGHLKILKLQKINCLHPAVFDFWTDMMPRLEHIEITDCFINCSAVNRVKIIDHIFYWAAINAPQIRGINIAGTPVDDIAMMKLARIPDLELLNFSMTFMGKISDDGIQALLRAQTHITHLDVSGSVGLTDPGMIQICMLMPNIKVLKIRQCVMLTCCGFRSIRELRYLEVLDVTECERIRDEGFVEGLTGGNWSDWKENLKELHMSSLSTLTEIPTIRIAERFPLLRVLDLSGSSNCMSDYTMQLINRYLLQLHYLNIDGCGRLSDAGICGLGFVDEYCDRYYNSRSKHLRSGKKKAYSISRLTQLRVLKLSACYHISDVSLKDFHFRELRELVISRLHVITLDGIRAVCNQCPGIESLDVTECKNITDKCVETIVTKLKRIKVLKLICCTQITNDSLHSIACHCKMIKSLYIRGCMGLTANPSDVLYGLSSLKNIYAN